MPPPKPDADAPPPWLRACKAHKRRDVLFWPQKVTENLVEYKNLRETLPNILSEDSSSSPEYSGGLCVVISTDFIRQTVKHHAKFRNAARGR